MRISELLDGPGYSFTTLHRLYKKPQISKKAQKIGQKFPVHQVPPIPPDVQDILDRCIELFQKGRVDDLTNKELKSVTTVFFHKDYLQNQQDFKTAILKLLGKLDRKALWRSLMVSYVFNFDRFKPETRQVASVLKEHCASLPKRWQNRLDKIDLLDVDKVEDQIADKLLTIGRSESLAEHIGMTGALAECELMINALNTTGAKVLQHSIRGEQKVIDQFLYLVTDETGAKLKNNSRLAAIIGLLGPYTDTSFENKSTAKRQKTIERLFIDSLGDPRIARNSAAWPASLPKRFGGSTFYRQCVDVLKKWAVLQTITLFMDIIEKHADTQFKRRRRFWSQYFDQGYITDAWVAFGTAARESAEYEKKWDERYFNMEWGSLRQADPNQSVLLMHVDDLTIAEWSHSGKCRIWERNNQKKPQLHKTGIYYGTSLRYRSDYEITHDFFGKWCRQLETEIHSRTGIRLNPSISLEK